MPEDHTDGADGEREDAPAVVPKRGDAELPARPSRAGAGRPRSTATDDEIRVGWKMAGIGFEVAAEVAAGALIGYLIDRWRGTGQMTWTLVGALAGIAVGLWSLIKRTLALNRQLDRAAAARKSARTAKPAPTSAEWDDNDDSWNEDREKD